MQDLIITQGDEKAYNLTFSSGEGAIDITGATVKMSVRRNLNDETNVIEKVVTDHTAPEEGKSTVTLTDEDTDIDLGDYYYDVQISGGALSKRTVMKGKFTVTWQITED